MMRFVSFMALVGLLASCGADGAPVRPTGGVTVTGGTDGVQTQATVGVVKGPVTLTLGF